MLTLPHRSSDWKPASLLARQTGGISCGEYWTCHSCHIGNSFACRVGWWVWSCMRQSAQSPKARIVGNGRQGLFHKEGGKADGRRSSARRQVRIRAFMTASGVKSPSGRRSGRAWQLVPITLRYVKFLDYRFGLHATPALLENNAKPNKGCTIDPPPHVLVAHKSNCSRCMDTPL